MTKTSSNSRPRRMTTADLAQARSCLEADRVQLSEELATARSDATTYLGLPPAGDDAGDAGARVSRIEQEAVVSDNAQLLLAQTAAALTRLEGGTYGTCESCNHPIDAAHLRAFPRATLCLHCRELAEHHH